MSAAHIDAKAVECHDGYILYPKSSDEIWENCFSRSKGPRIVGDAGVFGGFLPGKTQFNSKAERGCDILPLERTMNGRGPRRSPTENRPSSIAREVNCAVSKSERCCHSSPSIQARIPAKEVTVLGDIVLLRPNEEATENLRNSP